VTSNTSTKTDIDAVLKPCRKAETDEGGFDNGMSIFFGEGLPDLGRAAYRFAVENATPQESRARSVST
jgi:hypothetical protein